MKIAIALLGLIFSSVALAGNYCAKYENNTPFIKAINVVAQNMQYTPDELCTLPRLADIHVTTKNIVNKDQEIIPHTWVTLHYNEYSCQYFVRQSDLVVTAKNCYGTW